jgi:ABC-type multidrug transport system fused ATPase/permease subunit
MSELELPNPEELEAAAGKRFSKRVALTTALYAVLLAITSLGGNNATKDMMLSQQMSSNQWSYYQAKSIKESFAMERRESVDAVLAERGAVMKPDIRATYERMRDAAASDATRYSKEKEEILAQAKALEKDRDIGRAKDPYFDFAEVLLQLAIVTASIAILSGSSPVYLFSFVMAAFGAVLSLNGFLQLFTLPFLGP